MRARFAWRHGHPIAEFRLFQTLAFSPDGKLLASCGFFFYGLGPGFAETWLWDVAAGKQVARLEGERAGGHCVAFSPDGKLLATGGTDGVFLWDVTALLKHRK
jgi:WD40 repeat protein